MKNLLITCMLLCCILFSGTSVFGENHELNWIGHWQGEGKREQLVFEIKKDFEFLHPEVKVNFIFNKELKGPGKYYKERVAHVIANMIESGNIEWDVIHLDLPIYQLVAEITGDPNWGAKHLVNFSEVPGFIETVKPTIIDNPYYINQTGGIFPGPYVEGYIHTLWYNKAVADTIGIEIKERGMSIDDFLSYAKVLAEYNASHDSQYSLFNLAAWNRLDGLFEYLYRSQLDNSQYGIGTSFNLERARLFQETLHIFEKLAECQPAVNEGWRDVNWVEFIENNLHRKGLFTSGGTYLYGHFAGKKNGGDILPVEPPFIKQPNGLIGSYVTVFAVMKNSRHKQDAIDLMMLWSQPSVAQRWVEYTKNPTGVRGGINESLLATVGNNQDVYDKFVTDMQRAYGDMPMLNLSIPLHVFGKNCPITATEFRESLALILEGKLSASAFYNELLDKVLIDQQKQ
jgi:ABC-type glycerol-3-phosphate transport system substrate-binding protein